MSDADAVRDDVRSTPDETAYSKRPAYPEDPRERAVLGCTHRWGHRVGDDVYARAMKVEGGRMECGVVLALGSARLCVRPHNHEGAHRGPEVALRLAMGVGPLAASATPQNPHRASVS